jgi:hypothetical protein
MPPAAVRTIKDLIFWQYAKIISKSAGEGKTKYAFVMDRFKKLQSGSIRWSSSIREYVKEHDAGSACIYCGSASGSTLEHLLPLARGGPDVPDNAVWVCLKCNASKGSKRLYEWFGLNQKDALPRIAEGKYLKLLYTLHEAKGTLDATPARLCPECDMGTKCPAKGRLSVYCLEGPFIKS